MNTFALYMALSLSPLQSVVDTQSADLQLKQLVTNSLQQELTHNFSFTINTDPLLMPPLVEQSTTTSKATTKINPSTQPTSAASSRLSD